MDIKWVGNGLEAGARRELFAVGRNLTNLFLASTYDVTSDGKRFLVLYPESDRPLPITVALNWTAGLEK